MNKQTAANTMKESIWYALTADRLLKFSFIFRAPFNAEAQVTNGIKEKGKRKLARCQKAGPGEYDWLLNYLQRFGKVQPQSQLDCWELLEDASLLTHLSGLKKHLRWEAQRFQQSRWLVLDLYGLMWPGEPPWRTDNWRKKFPWAETWASKSDSILTWAHRKSSCRKLNLHMRST